MTKVKDRKESPIVKTRITITKKVKMIIINKVYI